MSSLNDNNENTNSINDIVKFRGLAHPLSLRRDNYVSSIAEETVV